MRVLVVDDDVKILRFLSSSLRLAGQRKSGDGCR